jgi:hypothetical protein
MIRGLMIATELDTARGAPHDVVMLDYGLRTPVIYLNNATSNFRKCPSEELKTAFATAFLPALHSYNEIVSGLKRDKVYVGLPKYSTLREVTLRLGMGSEYDDRTLATFILKPGEYLGPLPMAEWDDLHLSVPQDLLDAVPGSGAVWAEVFERLRSGLHVVYYKPRAYLPAFRFEVPASVAENRHRLGVALKAVEFQCSAPGVFEPFPLYLADRMVKHLPAAFPAFHQAVTNEMATLHDGDPGEVYLWMHRYRTEGGR